VATLSPPRWLTLTPSHRPISLAAMMKAAPIRKIDSSEKSDGPIMMAITGRRRPPATREQ
jgi:hypothetical protein